MANGEEYAAPLGAVLMQHERRRQAGWWERWEGPIKTVIPILVSLFLTWHQMEKRLELQAMQISQMQQQIDRTQAQITTMEGRIYSLVAALNRNSESREQR